MSIGNLIPILASANRAGAYVEDVFNTYLYKGNDGVQTITTGVDTLNDGGLIWFKGRTLNSNNFLFDTERGANEVLWSNNTTAELPTGAGTFNFSSDGFSLNTNGSNLNQLDEYYVAWTWKKQERFFDVITYTGTGSAQNISHNLGSVPGCIIVKRTDQSSTWAVYHRGVLGGTGPEEYYLKLNLDGSQTNSPDYWDDTAPTNEVFTVGSGTDVNDLNGTYVAYLFAHNDGDGNFGLNGDQDIIKCGRYSGNGLPAGQDIDLGFEPQFLLIKKANLSGNWLLHDIMRGLPVGFAADPYLFANDVAQENSENAGSVDNIAPLPNGFGIRTNSTTYNDSNGNYVYIAIRRGPMAVPESADEVFEITTQGAVDGTVPPRFQTSMPVDMGFYRVKNATQAWSVSSRLQQDTKVEINTAAEGNSVLQSFDWSNGYFGVDNTTGVNSENYAWLWKRAPGYFDVVAYTGDGVAGRTVSHNLGVAPEMMWVKRRDVSSDWAVYHSAIGNTDRLELNNGGPASSVLWWNNTTPTSTEFTVGDNTTVNFNTATYIAYLFASLDGVSKVGTYVGDGTVGRVIDCGFSSGAKFVLIKQYDNTTDAYWSVFDSERGIVSGNDSQLFLNTTDAEDTGHDLVDTTPSGFIVNHDNTAFAYQEVNADGDSYIFYAIAN
jgi:hypothetical protein